MKFFETVMKILISMNDKIVPMMEQANAGYEEAETMSDKELINHIKIETQNSKKFSYGADQRNQLNGYIKSAKERGLIKD